ncbi:MAG: hypothetical protein LBS49_01585, partial [Candidatus Accumulibacter sp.]|nr:hypothetical protein [Accumulibacter sp.]
MRQRYDWDKRKLNDKASAIIWEGTGVDESQKPAFDRVTRGIGGTGFPERWLFYKNIVEKVLGGGNPYEELREAMVKLGIKTNSGKGYEQHFGITLQSRAPEPIQGGPAHLLVDISNEILAASSASDLTPAEEEQLFAEARSLLAQQTQTSKESEIMWIPSLRSISELTFGIAISVVAAQPVEAAGYAIGECRVVNDT